MDTSQEVSALVHHIWCCCYGSQDHYTPVRTSGTGMTGYPYLDTTYEVVHLVGGHGYHAMDTSQEVSSEAYIYLLILAIRSWWVDHPLLLLQVLRTLTGCTTPYPRIHIALPASLLVRSHHYASGYTTYLYHVLVLVA